MANFTTAETGPLTTAEERPNECPEGSGEGDRTGSRLIPSRIPRGEMKDEPRRKRERENGGGGRIILFL